MTTVQQSDRFGASKRHNGYPRLWCDADDLSWKPSVQRDKLPPVNWAPVAVRPTIERATSTDEKRARVDNISKYSKYHLEPDAFVASMRPQEGVARRNTAVSDLPIVYVVDDDISTRESLEALIRRAGWRSETFGSAQEFLSKQGILERGCLLVDFNLPDLTGLDLQKRLPDRLSVMPIVFLTRSADVRIAVEAMKRGAIDFLTKPCDDEMLVEAIQRAFERSREIFDNARVTEAIHERRATLSRREHEVMTLVVTGLMNKQIGFELGISEITVKAHRGQVMRKMGAKSLAGLVMMAGQISLTAAPS